MSTSKFKIFIWILVAGAVYLILQRTLDPDTGAKLAATQRYGLVTWLLISGGYVILKTRSSDRQYYEASGSREAAAKRFRNLGILGWAFAVAGIVMAVRLTWTLTMP